MMKKIYVLALAIFLHANGRVHKRANRMQDDIVSVFVTTEDGIGQPPAPLGYYMAQKKPSIETHSPSMPYEQGYHHRPYEGLEGSRALGGGYTCAPMLVTCGGAEQVSWACQGQDVCNAEENISLEEMQKNNPALVDALIKEKKSS